MKFKQLLAIMSVVILLLIIGACGKAETKTKSDTKSNYDNNYAEKVKENPIVTITMEDSKKIIIELEPKTAPLTVANFIDLAQSGFYDGLTFHRVIEGFMIQGGDPVGTGTGGPGYAIKGEFSSNGIDNTISHKRGVISMARSQDVDSAGSQFFIMQADSTNLDGQYAAFGEVTSGMDEVDKISKVEKDASDKPNKDVIMKTVTVDTKGFDYPKPEVIK